MTPSLSSSRRWHDCIFLLLTASLATSQTTSLPEPTVEKNFCSLSSQALTIHDKKAFITGGWQIWSINNASLFNNPSPFMRTIDLSTSFSLTESINTYAPPITLPSQVPRSQNPIWWPSYKDSSNNTQLELMLGVQQTRKIDVNNGIKPSPWPMSSQLRFDPKSGDWEKEVRKTKIGDGMMEDVESRMYSSRASVWVERRRMGFVVMGLEVEDNVSRANGVEHAAYGMLVYDGEKKEWRNETGPHIMTENSHLVHLEAGKDDLLITLGEEEPSDDTGVSEFRLLTMRTVHIYSINQRKWFQHRIPSTSTAPQKRGAYCTALLPAPDRSSFQLFLLLGVSEPDTKSSWGNSLVDTSVWVLSLPSFTWIQLPESSSTAAADPGGRASSQCAVAGKGFILVTGGRKMDGQPIYNPICDKAGQNVFAYNAESMKWDHRFNPDLEYGVPSAVSKVIGGDRKGGATMKEPQGGWGDSTEVEKLFEFMKDPVNTEPAPGGSGSSETREKNNKNNTIAIAVGSAVSVVGVIIIVAVGIWYFRRRRRASPAAHRTEEMPAAETGWQNGGVAAGYHAGGGNGYYDTDTTAYGSENPASYGGSTMGVGGYYKPPQPGEMMAVEEVRTPSEMPGHGIGAVEAGGREIPSEVPGRGTWAKTQ